jgi:CDGSH-type Zn-finger protein
METNLNKTAQRHQLSSAESVSAAAATPEVRQHAKHSVTLCPCGKPARRTFCSSACRQAAYRKSTAHAGNLKRLRDAREARKRDYIAQKNACYKRLNAHRGFTEQTGIYGGPAASGVPSVRLGDLDLNYYLTE